MFALPWIEQRSSVTVSFDSHRNKLLHTPLPQTSTVVVVVVVVAVVVVVFGHNTTVGSDVTVHSGKPQVVVVVDPRPQDTVH